MFSNPNNSLPPTYSQSNTAATRDSDNRGRYDVSPQTRYRLQRADNPVVDPDAPLVRTTRDRDNNAVFKIVRLEDHSPNVNNPPTSDRLSHLAVALLLVIIILIGVLAMAILQHGEQNQKEREQDQRSQELLDRVLQILQEQRRDF